MTFSSSQRVGGIINIAEKAVLLLAAAATIVAVGFEIKTMIDNRLVELGDLLLLFLYAEVLSMVAVFYSSRELRLIYPIFIAMTALARLIVLQGKDQAPENLLFEAGAILLLAIAVVVMASLDVDRLRRFLARQDVDG